MSDINIFLKILTFSEESSTGKKQTMQEYEITILPYTTTRLQPHLPMRCLDSQPAYWSDGRDRVADVFSLGVSRLIKLTRFGMILMRMLWFQDGFHWSDWSFC